MPNLSAYLAHGGDLTATPTATAQQRAALAWRRINDKPTSVTFKTAAGVTLAAQTVRVEFDDGVGRAQSAAGSVPVRRLIVFGVRGHATVADTNVGEGYRYVAGGDEYTCVDVIATIGEVQANFEAVG